MAQKRKKNNLLYWLIGVVVVLLIVVVIGRSNGWIGTANELEVELTKATRTTIVETVSASGTVQPVIEVKLSPEVSGEIIQLTVEEGDSVKQGQLLVKIRPDALISQLERSQAALNQQKANLQASRASLSRAKATFLRAEQEYTRQQKLWEQKVISEADWQLAEQNYQVAKTDLASAEQQVVASEYSVKSSQASVSEAEENVRRTSIVAPMTGVVSKLDVKVGERVVGTAQMQGTEMLRIADLSAMEVRVAVNENDIVKVHPNDSVKIDVDAYPEKLFKGLVTHIANTAKDKTSADAVTEFEVRILILSDSYKDLLNEGRRYPFRPGMTASVEIITNRKENVLAVPLAAVTTRNADGTVQGSETATNASSNNNQNTTQQQPQAPAENQVVVFINDNGVAKKVDVKTGISDYQNIEILSGITDTTEVISGPFLVVSRRLNDGDKIKKKQATTTQNTPAPQAAN